jgi:hypothetical protein
MDDSEVVMVRRALSPARLAPYEHVCAADLRAALRLYVWNIAASGAFHGLLHVLEVGLRNALHAELRELFGRDDWWHAPNVRLHYSAAAKITRAEEKCSQQRKSHAPDDMVPELMFGFWVSLLGKGVDYENRLWRPALHRAFPAYTGKRAPLHEKLEMVRLLRNRVAHYEAIHHRHLEADHATIMRLIGFISPETAMCITSWDRVPEVLTRRKSVCGGSVPPSF